MTNRKIDVKSMNFTETAEFFQSLGEPSYRAKQFLEAAVRGAASFDEISAFSKVLREKLSKEAYFSFAEVQKKQVSKDGTVKFLFRFPDGVFVESVVMEYRHGLSICVSTQAGCNMGCVFCASGANGKERNLSAAEILDQIIFAQKDLGKRISNVVLMGMGEPLDNYDNVIRFLKIVNEEQNLNIGYRHISLSTCGLADKIRRLSGEELPITLSVSLHAPNDEIRNQIMPVNQRFNISELLFACREYFSKTNRRLSFEYTLIEGVNDSPRCAGELAALLERFPCHVNLIPVNPVRNKSFAVQNKQKINDFARILLNKGVNATIRRSLGTDIDAACGQLRGQEFRGTVKEGGST
jgi:23S rRNA (adenine2503-C2)-methyltransferase